MYNKLYIVFVEYNLKFELYNFDTFATNMISI